MALIFDLDDTLYDEADFVASGFCAVAAEAAGRYGLDAAAVREFLHAELARSGRGRVFDAMLAAFGIAPEPTLVRGLVECYRSHRPVLALHADAERALARLPRERMAVVTDGLPAMQRGKFAALSLDALVADCVYCWEHEAPKPDPRGFLMALERLGASPEQAVVVGDRPDHDIAAARALGMRSVRIRRGRFADCDAGPHVADREIATIDELDGILAGWGMGGLR